MAEKLTARGLAGVQVVPTPEPQTVAFVLADITGTKTGYLINPEGLNALLVPALGLAAQWADAPELQAQTLMGPQSALPAQHISLERGRNDKECAVRVFVGKIELTFLIPLDVLLSATAYLAQFVVPDTPPDEPESVN
jgi:hypothetical protein